MQMLKNRAMIMQQVNNLKESLDLKSTEDLNRIISCYDSLLIADQLIIDRLVLKTDTLLILEQMNIELNNGLQEAQKANIQLTENLDEKKTLIGYLVAFAVLSFVTTVIVGYSFIRTKGKYYKLQRLNQELKSNFNNKVMDAEKFERWYNDAKGANDLLNANLNDFRQRYLDQLDRVRAMEGTLRAEIQRREFIEEQIEKIISDFENKRVKFK